jgi:hypothetical protein
MDELVGQYNDLVKETTRETHKRDERLMYTVLSAAIPIISGVMLHDGTIPFAAASSIVAGVQFMRTERIEFDPAESKPAAMFYEANKALEGTFLDKLKKARRFWNR